MTIHSCGQTISSLSNIEGISLSAGVDIPDMNEVGITSFSLI